MRLGFVNLLMEIEIGDLMVRKLLLTMAVVMEDCGGYGGLWWSCGGFWLLWWLKVVVKVC
jgi:hypothetical protein